MPISTFRRLPPRHLILALLASWLALASPAPLRAATIQAGDVTATLGPTFFLDEASNGGGDADINQPSVPAYLRNFNGLLSSNQGPTRVTLTGFGFAAHTSATANDATTIAVTFTYLGADELVGGGDDVVIGTATGTYNFTVGGEYVFAFDTPLSADLTITGTRFRIQIAPSNASNTGSLKLKTPATGNYEAKLSVAGVATPLINPQRLNLAKFQPVTTDSVSGQRLASYVTDGVTGNDNRWESTGAGPHWARVDFPFPVEVGSAQLLTGTDDANPITNFNIQYLNVYDGTWVNIPGASVTGNTNVARGFVFDPPITASSFRVHSPDNTIRLRELALYPPNGPGGYPIGTDLTTNLAYQRPAVASANTAGNFARNAVDGRTHVGSTWQTNTAGINTLDIDLRVSTKIGSAHLYSGSTGVSPLGSFVMKYWDGAAWQNITGGTVTGNTTSDLVVPFTPVTTSQVRLEFTNPGTTSIRELCIFPANTGNVGYPIGTNLINSGAVGNYETYNDAFHRITNSASSREMSVPNSGQPSLDPAGLTFGQSQYQVLLNLSTGTYRIRNRATGNCLSGATLDQTPGLPLIDANYSALPHQDWILDPLGGGKFRFVNQWSGLVIDTQGSATAPGTLLVQNEANGSATQRWQITKYTWAPKKGIGGTTFAMATNPKWAYNWGRLNTQTIPADAPFFPMQWGNFSWDIGSGQGPIWQEYPNWRRRADGIHVLGFNEPDGYDQAGKYLDPTIPPTKEDFSWERSMAEAVRLWPRLQELDMPLVSPAPAGKDNGWLAGFYTQAANLGYRVDYTAVHTYPSPNGGSSQNLINFVQDAYDDWGRPVWLTEFSFVDWNKNQTWSEEDNYNCLAEFLWRAESLTALRKYALFVFTENAEWPQPTNSWTAVSPAPRSNSYDINGDLTAFGKLYAAWDSDTTIGTDKTYMIHNRGLRKRMANAATTNTAPGGRTIRTDGPIVNWTLVSTGVSNRYYVVSSIDGRRLSYIANSTTNPNNDPALAAPDTIGTAVEWSLTESQHGWHYLGHPQTNTRLKLLSFNTSDNFANYQLVSAGTTDNNTQWRFIVPLISSTAPVLTAIPPQTADEGTQLTFTASATDADLPADTLAYSLIGAPVGALINSATGVFTWTPAESQGGGSFNFSVRVSDGSLTHDQPVSVTVNETNVAPVLASIPPQTIDEGILLTFTASATDADLPANTLTYSLIGAPVGASINGSTGIFTWTPTEAQGPGSFNFTVRVSDGTLSHDQPVSVTVNQVNTAPVLAAIPPQTVNESTMLTFTASATDDGIPSNTLTYSLVGAPAGASINASTGVFTWTPTEAQGPGSFNFTVRVSDGTLTHDQPVSVTVNEVNVAPVLAAIPLQTVNQGSLLTFTASATDADLPANPLTYSLIGAPVGASIDSATGVFTWTPAGNQGPGAFNFTVSVSDGNLPHDRPVSVTVNEANVAPVLAAIPPQTVTEGNLLTFTASATDTDIPPDTLTFSLLGAPAGAALDSVTGIFSWTPTENQGPDTYNFTVRVSDGTLTHDQPVSVTVNEANVAPVLAAIPPQTVAEGTPLTFTASATDADLPANPLAYSLVGAPAGAAINSSTGAFTWTPAQTQGPATYNFTVRVSDGNLTHDQTVTVTVLEDGGADVLDTWIVSGQSNAEGYGITQNPVAGLTPNSTLATIARSDLNVTHNNVRMFQGATDLNGSITASAGLSLPPRNTWHAMTSYEGLAYDWGGGLGNESGRRFGPELAFGYDVQRQLGSSIALIKYARGSSSIAPSTVQNGDVWRDFDPSDGGRLNQYDKLVATIQAAVNSLPAGQVLKIRGVVWMQGESDATAEAAYSYQANLTELIATLRTAIGSIATTSGGRMTASAAAWNQLDVFIGTILNTSPNRQTVINAQNAVADADPNVFTVNATTGLSTMTVDDWNGSGIHYDTAGQVLLGERFADAAISRIDSGVLVSESGGATSVTEGGATDTYTVNLTRAPSADVIINVVTDSQVSVSPASLTFTTANWNTAQAVTVTAVDDSVTEPNHFGAISHGLSSLDLSFGGLPITGVTVAIIDNDVNTAPVLAVIPPQTVDQGTLLTFTASATDSDLPANTLTYSLGGEPAGASINSVTGTFNWTPTESQGPGSFNFTVQVSDGNLTHDQPVSVTVESPLPSSEVDTDGDGLSDLLEYAFLTNPGIPNGNPFRVSGVNAGTITLEFPWNWQATRLSWQIRHGSDLSNIAAWPVVAPGTTTTTREGNIDRITVAPTMAYPDRGFYVLEVIGN